MKKIWFFLSFILLSFLFATQNVNAAFSHHGSYISGYTDSDGLKVYVYQLSVDITGSTSLNHIKGKLILNNLNLVSFEANSNFVSQFDKSNLVYDMTSNHVYTSVEGKVIYATVKLKQKAIGDCSFDFEPIETKQVTTNSFTINKDAYKNNSVITSVKAGEEFQYKIIVTSNNNVIETDNVIVTDVIPKELEIISAPNGTISGQEITWYLGKFASGVTTKTLTVNVRAKKDTVGKVNNVAVLTVGDKSISDDAPINVLYSNITITKKASRSKVTAGGDFYYTIAVKNTGTGVSDVVTIEDTLDANLTFVSASENYQKSGNKYTFDIGTLEPNATKTIRVNVKVNDVVDVTNISNTAIATEKGKNPVDDTVVVDILEEVIDPDISIQKSVNVSEVKKMEEFQYTITVTNKNELHLIDMMVSDELDSNLILVDADGATVDGNLLTWLFDLTSNQTKTFTITVKVREDCAVTEIKNKAKLTYEEEDTFSDEVKVIVKEDEKPVPPPTDVPDVPDDPDLPNNPQTGNIISYFFLTLGLISSLIIFYQVRKKKKLFHI